MWEPCLPNRKCPEAGKNTRRRYAKGTPCWGVERSHSWLNRFRRLLIRWERREDTYLAMLHFACAVITWSAHFPFSGRTLGVGSE